MMSTVVVEEIPQDHSSMTLFIIIVLTNRENTPYRQKFQQIL